MDINWQGLITGAVTVFVITYFTKKAKFGVEDGQLKFGLFIKGLGIACLIFSLVPLVVLVTGNYQVEKPGETVALVGLAVGFGIAAIYSLAEGFLVRGQFDDKGIHFSTPWTGVKKEAWSDLESVAFNGWCYWYLLRFRSGKVIRISSYLGGHGYLLALLREMGHNV